MTLLRNSFVLSIVLFNNPDVKWNKIQPNKLKPCWTLWKNIHYQNTHPIPLKMFNGNVLQHLHIADKNCSEFKNLLCLPFSILILWYFIQKFSFPPERSTLLSTLPGLRIVSLLSPENTHRRGIGMSLQEDSGR